MTVSIVSPPGATAGLFDLFHHNDECYEQCPQYVYCCPEEEEKEEPSCFRSCFCPAAPPRAGIAFGIPAVFDSSRTFEDTRESKDKGKSKKEPKAATKDSADDCCDELKTKMEELDARIRRLSRDIEVIQRDVNQMKSGEK